MDCTLSELRALIVSCSVRRAGAKPGQSPPLPQKCTAQVSKSCSECHSFSWFSTTHDSRDEEALLCKSHWAPSKRQCEEPVENGSKYHVGRLSDWFAPSSLLWHCIDLTDWDQLTSITSFTRKNSFIQHQSGCTFANFANPHSLL